MTDKLLQAKKELLSEIYNSMKYEDNTDVRRRMLIRLASDFEWFWPEAADD